MVVISTAPRYSSSKFTYLNNVFTAEASDFNSTGFPLGFVYDDSVDPGFVMVSEWTGKLAVFRSEGPWIHRDELEGWEFKCITPGLTHLKTIILND